MLVEHPGEMMLGLQAHREPQPTDTVRSHGQVSVFFSVLFPSILLIFILPMNRV